MPLKEWLANRLLGATGWHAEGVAPPTRRCVVIAAPHTSNWDLLYMLAFAWHFGVRPSFLMKHSVFVGPAGWLFRRLGGIPVERHHRRGVVKQLSDAFAGAGELTLVVPPEGTRGHAPYWKSGFYHVAREAGVPIVPAYLDWSRKAGGFGPAFLPSSDMRADMEILRDFYADKVGRHPGLSGPIRLREEEDL